jgi:hypothetical protein
VNSASHPPHSLSSGFINPHPPSPSPSPFPIFLLYTPLPYYPSRCSSFPFSPFLPSPSFRFPLLLFLFFLPLRFLHSSLPPLCSFYLYLSLPITRPLSALPSFFPPPSPNLSLCTIPSRLSLFSQKYFLSPHFAILLNKPCFICLV